MRNLIDIKDLTVASSSSTAKGESVSDTIRTVGCYDVLLLLSRI